MDPCPYCHAYPVYEYVTGRAQRRVATNCGYPACRLAANRARQRAWRAAKRKARTYECQVCHAAIELPAGTVSGHRSLCDSCRAIGHSVALVMQRTRGDERYVCPCGAEFTRPQTKGQRPRWCPTCTKGRRGWKRANPGSVRRADAKRRSAIAIEAETFAPDEIFERDAWRCQIPGCGRRVRRDKAWPHPMSPTLDHIIPVSEGGHHVRANVRCAHARCNTARGNRGGNDQLLLIG